LRIEDDQAKRWQPGELFNFCVCLHFLLNAYLSHKALMLKMAHVVERKKVAFRQKRQANTKIEQQIRLLDKQAVEAHKQLLTDDNPVTCVPNHHAYSAVLISIFLI
jgi:hypothetical protein